MPLFTVPRFTGTSEEMNWGSRITSKGTVASSPEVTRFSS